MKKSLAFVVIFIVIVGLLVWGIRKSIASEEEGFLGIDDYPNIDRGRYIELGQSRFNRFADPLDVFRPGVMGAKVTDEGAVRNFNSDLKRALMSVDLEPTSDMKTNTTVKMVPVKEAYPLENNVLKEAKKCEAVTTRDACARIGTPGFEKCGVCIKQGTDAFETKPGAFIGGMLLLPEDREYAENAAIGTGAPPAFQPTAGSCPPGYFFADRDTCEKEVNRLNCKEAGETGGFNNGVTIEGRRPVSESCALCPVAGDTTYLYEPKTRKFPIRVRAIAPSGTGITTITVLDKVSQAIIGQTMISGGSEAVLDLTNAVQEGQEIAFSVQQEFPHRPRGTPEAFLVSGAFNKEGAASVCGAMGGRLATYKELVDSQSAGAQTCDINTGGYVADDSKGPVTICPTAKVTIYEHADYNGRSVSLDAGSYGLGNLQSMGFTNDIASSVRVPAGYSVTLFADRALTGDTLTLTKDTPSFVPLGWNDRVTSVRVDRISDSFNIRDIPASANNGAWCMDIKPPTGDYSSGSRKTFINPFKKTSNEIQNSQVYGDLYAPFNRAIILQWEMRTADNKRRRFGIEPSIVSVMGQSPSTTTSDGFKIFRILRRKGMFSTATKNSNAQIMSPTSASNPNIISNLYWLWSNQNLNAVFDFTCMVPGIFRDPFYKEDLGLCPRGQLVGQKSTLDLMKVSPCLKEGQAPGKYDIDCLKFLFASAGGSLYNGRLSPILSGNLDTLRKDNKGTLLEQDDIMFNLSNKYSIATTGRTLTGAQVGSNSKERRKIVNEAGLDMFGIEIVSPCEEVAESTSGDIQLVQKSAPFDADCLDFLYFNAGTDKSRGFEGVRNSSIKATYQNITSRFSGLLMSEKDTPENKEKYPFQTCQRGGTMAPIDAAGKTNYAGVQAANARALARDGSIRSVQDFYNTIFQEANKSISSDKGDPSPSDVLAQQANIKMCFGIDKPPASKASTGCGIMARYIRVLRSSVRELTFIYAGQKLPNVNHIQISQLQAFDSLGNEINDNNMKTSSADKLNWWWDNKAITTDSAIARDGINTVKSFPNIYHDSASSGPKWWMMDLGDVYEVRKVKYYSRAKSDGWDTDKRALEMPIQLLDENKVAIAHKLTSQEAVDNGVETLEFAKKDATPEVRAGEIRPGLTCMFEAACRENSMLIRGGNAAATTAVISTNSARALESATLRIMPAAVGLDGAISIQNANGELLFAHPENNTMDEVTKLNMKGCYFAPISATQNSNWARAATWIVRPAASGEAAWFSLQNAAYPSMYLVTPTNWIGGVFVQKVIRNDPLSQLRASWRIRQYNSTFNPLGA